MNGKIVALAVLVSVAATGVAQAQGRRADRQDDKNAMRTLGIGLGVVAADQLLRGRVGDALLAGAASAYAGKKYEDARKAQREETGDRWDRRRDDRWDRRDDDRRWDRRDDDARWDRRDDDRRDDDRWDGRRDDGWRAPERRRTDRLDLTGPSCVHRLRDCDRCRHGEPVRGGRDRRGGRRERCD